jgi:protein-disulfide isomerase
MSINSNKGPKKDRGMRGLVIGMVLFVVVVGVAFSLYSNKSNSSATLPSTVSKADGYGIVFNASAKPQIDIWEDFQCPICQRFESINNSYLNEVAQGGKAKVVFHPMSFIGAESILAANAAACSADAGKFLGYHKLLYQNQATTENSGKWSNQFLEQLGQVAGITNNSFINCIQSAKYGNWTKNINADGAAKNVNSTPTIFVNGKELDRATQYMDPVAFKKALTDAGVK